MLRRTLALAIVVVFLAGSLSGAEALATQERTRVSIALEEPRTARPGIAVEDAEDWMEFLGSVRVRIIPGSQWLEDGGTRRIRLVAIGRQGREVLGAVPSGAIEVSLEEAREREFPGSRWVSIGREATENEWFPGSKWFPGSQWVPVEVRMSGSGWVPGDSWVPGNSWVPGDSWIPGSQWLPSRVEAGPELEEADAGLFLYAVFAGESSRDQPAVQPLALSVHRID